MGKIYETLEEIGIASLKTKEVFSKRTRDCEDLFVYRDSVSGVIYIDDYYIGDENYKTIDYKKSRPDYERETDTKRRVDSFKQFYIGKRVLDIGCGEGLFLKKIKDIALEVCGVEIQHECQLELLNNNIECKNTIHDYQGKFDTIFMFHSLEHFNDPLEILKDAKEKLKTGGKLVVEVPHANDFLINTLKCKSFIDFTLWSQHLVLHTRESLERILKYSGFGNIVIHGKQRYGLSNHLQWLSKGKPGGHVSILSVFDQNGLSDEYENALSKIDATDTIVAISDIL